MKYLKVIALSLFIIYNYTNTSISKSLFSHVDDLKKELINLINNENEAIKVCIFIIAENNIIEAFAQASKRGVSIEMVIDKQNLAKEKFNKIDKMLESGIKINYYKFDYNPKISPVMHNKFCVFKSNLNNEPILWTGSYNFTFTASHFNKENALIITDPATIENFSINFDALKPNTKPVEQSRRYKKWKLKSRQNLKN